MSYIHHKVPIFFNSTLYHDLVTFHDRSKFKIEYIKTGNLTPGSIGVKGDDIYLFKMIIILLDMLINRILVLKQEDIIMKNTLNIKINI
jgi:hypothetical protein